MDIDTSQVLKAASTKWNFINLQPGLVGGHCIGIDPYYLSFKAKELGYKPDLIIAARQINNGMSKFITDKTIKEMVKSEKNINGSSILILGATFKEDCPDMRNTKVLEIVNLLKDFQVNVDIFDPWVDYFEQEYYDKYNFVSNPLLSEKKYDAIVVAVAHKEFKAFTTKNYNDVSNGNKVIIDVKNIVTHPTWRL